MRPFWQPLLLAVLLAGFWLAGAGEAMAQRGGYYYTVQRGDSLTEVARRHGMSASELARDNRLTAGSSLVPGSRLWVARAPAAAASSPSTTSRAPASATPRRNIPAPSGVMITPSPDRTPTGSTAARQPAARSNIPANAPRPFAPSTRPTSPAPTPRTGITTSGRTPDTYVVQNGDSLWRVADRHGMQVSDLARINGLNPDRPLHVGQQLRLRGGSDGSGAERMVDVPGGGVERQSSSSSAAPSTSRSSASLQPSRQGFIWPVEGRVIRQFLNRPDEKYTGIDIAAPKGTEVRAARDGKVVYAGDSIPAYGRMAIISHSGNLATVYGHTDRLLVREGQQVRQGQVIARSGDTGRGREPFLHFEIRRDGDAVNPIPFLP